MSEKKPLFNELTVNNLNFTTSNGISFKFHHYKNDIHLSSLKTLVFLLI